MRFVCAIIAVVAFAGLVGSYQNGITNNVFFFGVLFLVFGIIGLLDYIYRFDDNKVEERKDEE